MKTEGRREPPTAPAAEGQTVTLENGEQYFIMGNNRIKITEHFPPDGKSIEELVVALIECKAKEKVSEIS